MGPPDRDQASPPPPSEEPAPPPVADFVPPGLNIHQAVHVRASGAAMSAVEFFSSSRATATARRRRVVGRGARGAGVVGCRPARTPPSTSQMAPVIRAVGISAFLMSLGAQEHQLHAQRLAWPPSDLARASSAESVMRADPIRLARTPLVRDRLASVRPPVTTGIARINYVRPTPFAPYGWPVDPDSDAELGERVPKVRVDRVQRQVKVFGHLPVGGTLSQPG